MPETNGEFHEVALSAPDLLNSRLLLGHLASSRVLFSPIPVTAGTVDGVDVVQRFANEYRRTGEGWSDYEAFTSVFANIRRDGDLTMRASDKASDGRLNTAVRDLTPQLRSFAEISYADRRRFFSLTEEDDVTLLMIDVYWSRQQTYLLDHWQPRPHCDGIGGRRGEWILGHIASIGDPTLHWTGQFDPTERDNGRGIDVGDKRGLTLPSGAVTRIHRTSVHARPIRFDGGRLFFRTFHNIGLYGDLYNQMVLAA